MNTTTDNAMIFEIGETYTFSHGRQFDISNEEDRVYAFWDYSCDLFLEEIRAVVPSDLAYVTQLEKNKRTVSSSVISMSMIVKITIEEPAKDKGGDQWAIEVVMKVANLEDSDPVTLDNLAAAFDVVYDSIEPDDIGDGQHRHRWPPTAKGAGGDSDVMQAVNYRLALEMIVRLANKVDVNNEDDIKWTLNEIVTICDNVAAVHKVGNNERS